MPIHNLNHHNRFMRTYFKIPGILHFMKLNRAGIFPGHNCITKKFFNTGFGSFRIFKMIEDYS